MAKHNSKTACDRDSSGVLPVSFFERSPELVARDLLGCVVTSRAGGVHASGRIVETEAYLGADDVGSHAATRGMTRRNSVMFGPAAVAYVYFTYGNHHMLNIVCEPEGVAGAVLLRALEPTEGIAEMTARRGGRSLVELCNGPGKLAAALGLDLTDNGVPLSSGRVCLYDGARPLPGLVAVSGRVGLSVGHERQLRYYIDGNPFVSRARTGPVQRTRFPRTRLENQ